METTENKALVFHFRERFSAGDYAAALDLLTDDASWWVAGSTDPSGTCSKAEFAT